jgi:hypothetical protein
MRVKENEGIESRLAMRRTGIAMSSRAKARRFPFGSSSRENLITDFGSKADDGKQQKPLMLVSAST